MRVVLAEDSVLLRDGLVRLLRDAGHEVVAAVGDAAAFDAAVHHTRPDLSIVDVRMPPTHTDEGLQAALRLRRDMPESRILVLSQYVEPAYARDLLLGSGGGIGYLLKDRVSNLESLVDAMESIAAGGTVLDPEVLNQLLQQDRRGSVRDLTARERDVLQLMAAGRSNAAIARQLFISEGAVEKNVSSIFTRLGLMASETDHRRVLAVLKWLNK